jgi:hypothetical protein
MPLSGQPCSEHTDMLAKLGLRAAWHLADHLAALAETALPPRSS